MQKLFTSLALALPLLALAPAHAAAVAPSSYVFDGVTNCGSFCYHDANLSKLTDGQYGVAGWAADIGQGNAAEWVGFAYQPRVNIDFSFSSVSDINKVSIGSTQDGPWDVTLPTVEVYQKIGGDWTLAGSLTIPASNDNNNDPFSLSPHTFLNLSGLNIHSDQVRVSLYSNGPWIFADEVRFTSAVPEPETFGMMLAGLGLLGLRARRKGAVKTK